MSKLSTVTDAVFMIENEIYYIRTGRREGPIMRDCIGQWEALLRELKLLKQELEPIQ